MDVHAPELSMVLDCGCRKYNCFKLVIIFFEGIGVKTDYNLYIISFRDIIFIQVSQKLQYYTTHP
jgi:hypothetical protein